MLGVGIQVVFEILSRLFLPFLNTQFTHLQLSNKHFNSVNKPEENESNRHTADMNKQAGNRASEQASDRASDNNLKVLLEAHAELDETAATVGVYHRLKTLAHTDACAISRHITSRHITSHHVTSHHITSHHITSRHINNIYSHTHTYEQASQATNDIAPDSTSAAELVTK
jgi:hypothetical protein